MILEIGLQGLRNAGAKIILPIFLYMGMTVLSVTPSFSRGLEFEGDTGKNDAHHRDSFPVPTGNPNQLFYLQRTPNTNTVVYELNFLENGDLNEREPVHVFWIRYPEGGMRKELNFIQRKYAYGVNAEHTGDGRYKLIFAAYKKKNLYLSFAARDQKYHVYTSFGDKVVILTKVFIKINPGGTFWLPNVEYIEMRGNEPGSNQNLYERIMIDKN